VKHYDLCTEFTVSAGNGGLDNNAITYARN